MELHLRGEIKFPKFTAVAFDRFAPLVGKQARTPLGNSGFEIVLSVDPTKHQDWITDLDQLEHLEKVHGLSFTGLYVELFIDVADGLAKAMKTKQSHPDRRQLCERIADALEGVHDSFVEFARHDAEQYWLPRRRSPSGPLHQRLLHYEARVRVEEHWLIVSVDQHEPVEPLVVQGHEGIGPERWREFLDRLRGGGAFRTQHPYRRMLTNAQSHLRGHDLRAAIIEGVAAWEMALTALGSKTLARSATGYSLSQWMKHIEKAGLAASSALLFAMTANSAAAAESTAVRDAIELRNNVVHNGQHKLDENAVESALWAIRRVIKAFEVELADPTQ